MFFGVVVGGFVGGLGLVLSVSMCHPKLLSLKYPVVGAVIGAVSAQLFEPSISTQFSEHPESPFLAFAIWQAAVGTYLYAICTYPDKSQPEDSPSV